MTSPIKADAAERSKAVLNNIDELLMLLENRLSLFLEFEEYTAQLNECDIDAIGNYITKRAAIANQIDDVTRRITAKCETLSTTPAINDIISNKCSFGEVPEELKPLFAASQQTIAAVKRCQEHNDSALIRMQTLQEYLKRRIAETKNTPKIIKYLSASGAGNELNSFSRIRKA